MLGTRSPKQGRGTPMESKVRLPPSTNPGGAGWVSWLISHVPLLQSSPLHVHRNVSATNRGVGNVQSHPVMYTNQTPSTRMAQHMSLSLTRPSGQAANAGVLSSTVNTVIPDPHGPKMTQAAKSKSAMRNGPSWPLMTCPRVRSPDRF